MAMQGPNEADRQTTEVSDETIETMPASTMPAVSIKQQMILAAVSLFMISFLLSPMSGLWNEYEAPFTEGDTDGDGVPDISDDDIDGDGVPNDLDDDIDGDGVPNVSDVDSDNPELGQWNSYFAATSADLPACNNLTNGQLYYIEADGEFQACIDSGWAIIDIDWSTSETTLTSLSNPLDSLGCDSGQTVQHGLDNGDGGGFVANGILETGEVDLSVTYCARISYFEELRILKDINPGGESSTSTLEGGDMVGENFSVVVGNTLYFEGDDGTSIGLWKTDGTAQGTVLVKENIRPDWMVAVGNTLFFSASDSLAEELWKSDGTAEGTVMVKDINPGGMDNTTWTENSSNPRWLTEVNGSLFFTADDGTNGRELWMSDGTENGTVMVKDINSGNSSSFGWNGYSRLKEMGDMVYFGADDGVHGTELWKSNGTAEGTVMIEDIHSDGSGLVEISLYQEAVIDDVLYFVAKGSESHGFELWKSDGTSAGTVMVKDIDPGSSSSSPYLLTAVGSTLYFSVYGGGGLWKSDGTELGTLLVKDNITPRWIVAAGDTLFFTVDVGFHDGPILVHVIELWKSDGTTEGTVMITDIDYNSNGSGVLFGERILIVSGETLYFSAYDEIHGIEIWRTDGSEEGTIMVTNIFADHNPNCSMGGVCCCDSRGPAWVTELGGNLVFFANDGVNGWEPWIATEFQDGSNYTITTEVIYSVT